MAFCHLHFFFPMELITFYLRIFLSPLCQRGSLCKSTLMTACPCCSTRQLSDRTVFQWILKAIVAARDFKSQRHKVLDKQGRCIAAGGKCAMKSLGIMLSKFRIMFITLGNECDSGPPACPWPLWRTRKVWASTSSPPPAIQYLDSCHREGVEQRCRLLLVSQSGRTQHL